MISLQNVDREHAFSESDQQLLETLAGSLSVALENARLVHETRQRNAELALINSVQEAIAGELDAQAIYDAVGDRIRDVFDAQVVSIATVDDAGSLIQYPYLIERGERLQAEPRPLAGFAKHVLETREPLLITENLDAESERYGSSVVAGERPKSVLFVPLVAGGKAAGVISLQNIDREHAFDEDDQRLLTTLGGSLTVALENARLVQETRQRVGELATVNSVGQALSSQLDLDGLIELVGEQVRETFDADIAYVALHDEAAGQIEFAYYYESGERRPEAPMKYGEGLTSADPPVARAAAAEPERSSTTSRRASGTPSLSYLGVPILVGNKAIGVDQRPEHRRGRPLRRSRLAPARDDRRQRRRRDPERAPVLRDRPPEAVLRDARRGQPGRGRRDGCRGAGDRLEPRRGGALRLHRRRSDRPPDRRARGPGRVSK